MSEDRSWTKMVAISWMVEAQLSTDPTMVLSMLLVARGFCQAIIGPDLIFFITIIVSGLEGRIMGETWTDMVIQ